MRRIISDWRDHPKSGTDALAGVELSGEGRTDLSNGWQEQAQTGERNWMIERVDEGDFAQVIHEHLLGGRFKITMTAEPAPNPNPVSRNWRPCSVKRFRRPGCRRSDLEPPGSPAG